MLKQDIFQQTDDTKTRKVEIKMITPGISTDIQDILSCCPMTEIELKVKLIDEITEAWNSEARV